MIILNKTAIAELIPHADEIVLLDSCILSSAEGLTCISNSHTDKNNPLRNANGLSATSGVEYAAQAIAVHAALQNNKNTGQGLLVACKNIICRLRYLDTIATEIQIQVEHIGGSVELGVLQYKFHINASGKVQKLISGELSIAITKEDIK